MKIRPNLFPHFKAVLPEIVCTRKTDNFSFIRGSSPIIYINTHSSSFVGTNGTLIKRSSEDTFVLVY